MNAKATPPVGLVIKFLLLSLAGAVSFLIPLRWGNESGTLVSLLTGFVGRWLEPAMDMIVICIIAFSAFGSLYDQIAQKRGWPISPALHQRLSSGIVYIISKFITLAFTVMCTFGLGSSTLNETAQSMVDLGGTLVSLAFALSFLLVFLTDSGLMEFIAELTKPFVRPLFKVPSDASLDLLASWLGASDAAVILTQQKYRKGFYSRREAATIMCNFSLVSVPFCVVVAEIGNVGEYFIPLYLLICGLGILLGAVMPRLYPLNRIPDDHIQARPIIPFQQQQGGMLLRGLTAGCEIARSFSLKTVWASGLNTVCSVLLGVMPVAIGWGVLGMLLIEFTPIFNWLAVPMGLLLDLLGVEEAFSVAPATLVGFIDMYIPALLVAGIESVRTRFIITTLSLIQIVYVTIVGAVVFQSKVGLDIKKLFLVFMERTLISLPIIALFSHLIVR